jgi:acyl-CoA synthetase (AMP-forming)/AMP-acid ligase II
MYARLLEKLGGAGMPAKLDTHLRFAYAGGSPLSPTLKAQVEQLLGVPLHNGYGLTETAPTVSQTRLDQPRSDTSVGHAIPGVEVRVETGSDGAGELWVRGPNVMRGYYQEPELTAAVLRDDGWLNTGDIVRQEVDGALFIVGRTKELIIRSGFNVYPLEVETVLNAHPAVTQSAVVGRGRRWQRGSAGLRRAGSAPRRHRRRTGQLSRHATGAIQAPFRNYPDGSPARRRHRQDPQKPAAAGVASTSCGG